MRFLAVALLLSGATAHDAAAEPAVQGNALIVGEVRVCNIPDHCLTRTFKVTATDRSGRQITAATTSGTANRYRLRVTAGRYALTATSSGLHCAGSTTARANRTVTANVICLVP